MIPKELGFFSLPTNDIDRAKEFFQSVMGWSFKDRDPDFSYIFAGDSILGSLETSDSQHAPSKTGPLLYFRAEKLESALDAVRSNSGEVLFRESLENGEKGYRAFFADPSGNRLAFWAPEL